MWSRLACGLVLLVACVSSSAADPTVLKLSFFTSDRELAFQAAVKPFVDCVNRAGEGVIRIEAYPSGGLGGNFSQQAELVQQGAVDIAFVNPALTPGRFPDQQAMQLPGMFRSVREATLVYNTLMSARAFGDLDKFVVIAALVNHPLIVHSRPPLASLADFRGKRLRASNVIDANVLKKFGAIPSLTPIHEITDAISRGILDGATTPFGPLFEFGIARLANYHYLLPLGAAPLLILMNREKFTALPPRAQEIIRQFGGMRMAEGYLEKYEARTQSVVETLRTNPRRIVIEPSAADRETAQKAFAAVNADWLAVDPRHREIFAKLEGAIAEFRIGRRADETRDTAIQR